MMSREIVWKRGSVVMVALMASLYCSVLNLLLNVCDLDDDDDGAEDDDR